MYERSINLDQEIHPQGSSCRGKWKQISESLRAIVQLSCPPCHSFHSPLATHNPHLSSHVVSFSTSHTHSFTAHPSLYQSSWQQRYSHCWPCPQQSPAPHFQIQRAWPLHSLPRPSVSPVRFPWPLSPAHTRPL